MVDNTRRIWITASHPSVSLNDTIGDMVRIRALARAIEQQGWHCDIITTDTLNGRYGLSPGVREAPVDRQRKNRLKTWLPVGAWNAGKDIAYLLHNRRFLRYLHDLTLPRPDLIIDYNFYCNNAALRFARHHRLPLISNIEGLMTDTMEGVARSWLQPLGNRLEIAKYRSADMLWAVSEPLAARLQQCLGNRQPPLTVVPNAVTTGNTSNPQPIRQRLGLTGQPIIGFVGGLSNWYALDRLIEICHRLRRTYPGLQLLIVGDGPERGQLTDLIERLQAGDWCLMTGLVPHRNVADYIGCFDIGVITRHQWWTCPLKLIEYGAQGIAVVAPDLPSITAIAPPDEIGLFKAGDYDSFTAALTELIEKSDRRRTMADRFEQRIQQHYSLDAMQRRIAASVDRLLS